MNFFKKYTNYIQIVISLIMFAFIINHKPEMLEPTFSNIIYLLLSFIVILEIVNMIEQYIVQHFIQLRLVIDTFFIFILRETILAYTNHKMEGMVKILDISGVSIVINEKLFYIGLGIAVMGILMFFRVKAMTSSPNETNCEKCVAKENCDKKEVLSKKDCCGSGCCDENKKQG